MRHPTRRALQLLLGLYLIPAPAALAQAPGRITGTVTSEAGVPLAGVGVSVVGTQVGGQTGADGRYSIAGVQPGPRSVRASRIGFAEKVQTVTVGAGEAVTLDFRLSAQAVQLEGVVAVGYGTQKKTSLTGSVATVQAEELETRAVSNPVQALQGKMPGLRITQSNGQPGREGTSLSIRGVGSFASGNSPLVIVDGVVGDLSDLDPNSIESISVLKDASSAAIYGARGANGVVVVTTKRGERAQDLQINYSGKMMRQSLINLPDLVWNSVEWMDLYNRAIQNGRLGIPLYPDSIIDRYRTPTEMYPSFNWAEAAFDDPIVQSHNVSFTGRSGPTNYYAGLGAWDQDGIMKGFYYQKYTAALNLDSRVNERIKFGVSLKGAHDEAKQPYNGPGDVMISLWRSRPTFGPLLPDGSGRYTSRAWPLIEVPRGEKNLFGLAEMGGERNGANSFVGNVSTDVSLRDDLVWTTRVGAQYDQNKQKYQRPLIPTYNWFTGDFDMYADQLSEIMLRDRVDSYNYYTAYSTLNYDRSFGDHNLTVMAGTSMEKSATDRLEGTRRGFASHSLDVLNAGPAEGQTSAGFLNEYALTSLFGRVNYNYLEKYLFEATVRRDGSSRFPPANKYAVFPSASLGWRLSQESFFEQAFPFVDELKLRGSYGLLGKDDVGGFYPYQAALRLGYDYPFGGVMSPGIARIALNNEQIRWEETSIADLGLDLVAGGGLLSLTADYYLKTTSGILRPSQIPGYAGLSAPVVNEGVVENRGVELTLGHQNRIGDFDYGANLVFSRYRNRIVKFGAPSIGSTTIRKEGMEIDRWFMYQADGVYHSQAEIDAGPTPLFPAVPGDIRLRDVDGDGRITADDRVDVDGRMPDYEFGLDLRAGWKGFDVSAFFQGERGRKIWVNDWFVRPFQGGGGVLTWWRDAWSPENPGADKPRLVHAESRNNSIWGANSTYWLRDASYTRLRNLTLGYTVPQRLSQRVGLDRTRLYLNGENLVTLTPFEFGNPEQGSNNSYPFYRTLMLGLDVGL